MTTGTIRGGGAVVMSSVARGISSQNYGNDC
jgi:hypothetical protein